MTRVIKLPKRFMKLERGAGTVATQNRMGLFTGRVRVRGSGDMTKVIRVKKDVDVNKDGKVDFIGGGIYGRETVIKGNNRHRSYTRMSRP